MPKVKSEVKNVWIVGDFFHLIFSDLRYVKEATIYNKTSKLMFKDLKMNNNFHI